MSSVVNTALRATRITGMTGRELIEALDDVVDDELDQPDAVGDIDTHPSDCLKCMASDLAGTWRDNHFCPPDCPTCLPDDDWEVYQDESDRDDPDQYLDDLD